MKTTVRDAAMIRQAIRNCEAISDEYQGAMARLKLAMLTARANPEVLPHAGQLAFARLSAAEKDAQAASNNLARTHDELSRMAERMGPDHYPTHESAMAGGSNILDTTQTKLASLMEAADC